MVPREPALPTRPPAAKVPQPGLGRAGPPRGYPASGTWTAPLPPRPTRMPVVIPRPAPPRRRPVLWLSVLFVLLMMAAAGSYLAITTPAGRAVRVGVEAYVVDHWRLLLPVGIVGGLSWGVWGVRKLLSVLYRPTVNDFRTTTSVVVPSYREDPDVLDARLDTWLGQDPDQVIIVLDVADTEAQRRLLARKDPRLRVILFEHAGKRSALGVGIRAARGEILVLTDSDTRWSGDCWQPCRCRSSTPRSAGWAPGRASTSADTSVWRRVADWLVNIRYLDYVPATGRAGRRGVRLRPHRRLPAGGRAPVLPHLEDEFFLGRRCIAGDDGRLTWLVLAAATGPSTSPRRRPSRCSRRRFRAFCKQRVRWSRNSYRCYLTAMCKGWLWRVPFITQVTVCQILLTPVTMAATSFYLVVQRPRAPDGQGRRPSRLVWLLIGRALRNVVAPADATLRHPAAAAGGAGDHVHRPADQALRVPDHEQAGMAHPNAHQSAATARTPRVSCGGRAVSRASGERAGHGPVRPPRYCCACSRPARGRGRLVRGSAR